MDKVLQKQLLDAAKLNLQKFLYKVSNQRLWSCKINKQNKIISMKKPSFSPILQ